MRSHLGAVLLAAGLASACTAISGLNGYSGSSPDIFGEGGTSEGDQVTPPGDDAANDQVATPPGDDTSDDQTVIDPTEAGGDPEAGPIGDAKVDGPPPCSPSTCNGCCKGTVCYGGQSPASCGLHGAACVDCSSESKTCTAGACAVATSDASTSYQCTSTNLSACSSTCSVAIYTACCKSDHTCGCQWTGFDPVCN